MSDTSRREEQRKCDIARAHRVNALLVASEEKAKQLERELNAARAELAALKAAVMNIESCGTWVAPVSALEQMRKALELIQANMQRIDAIPWGNDGDGGASCLAEDSHAIARAALKAAAPEPLDRPDRPGWWWKWHGDKWTCWLVGVPDMYSQSTGKWLPATPPPVPSKKEVET